MAHVEPLPSERGPLIERINKVRFRPTRFHAGYDERAVDDYLDGIVRALEGSSVAVVSARIRDAVFPQTRIKGGYLIEDVDEFRRLLADAVQNLR